MLWNIKNRLVLLRKPYCLEFEKCTNAQKITKTHIFLQKQQNSIKCIKGSLLFWRQFEKHQQNHKNRNLLKTIYRRSIVLRNRQCFETKQKARITNKNKTFVKHTKHTVRFVKKSLWFWEKSDETDKIFYFSVKKWWIAGGWPS